MVVYEPVQVYCLFVLVFTVQRGWHKTWGFDKLRKCENFNGQNAVAIFTEKDRKGPKGTEKDRKDTEKDRKDTEKDRKDTEKNL